MPPRTALYRFVYCTAASELAFRLASTFCYKAMVLAAIATTYYRPLSYSAAS
jgi:hypothetical protein